MTEAQQHMAYIGLHSCGGWQMLIVDNPEHRKDVTKAVSQALRWGLIIERKAIAEAKTIPMCDCKGTERLAR